MSRWLADAHHVSILGVPSRELSKTLKENEKARVKAQQEKLGDAGLKRLAEKLEKAKVENFKPVLPEILESFKVPGVESIHFIPTDTARSGLAKEMGDLNNTAQICVDQDKADVPLFIHFESVPTNFAHINLILSTGSIPQQLKPILAIYINNFFKNPIIRDGKRIEFEQVVTELEKDTVTYTIDAGTSIANPELLHIRLSVEREKYETAIGWFKNILFNSIFDVERLRATLAKMLADIPEEKRSGPDMTYAVDSMIHYAPNSSSHAQNTLVKALYLKRINKLLSKDPDAVISRLEELRKILLCFSNMRALVVADVTKLPNPVSAWTPFVDDLDTSQLLAPLDSHKGTLSEAAKSPGKLSYIIPMPIIDSSNVIITAHLPDSYNSSSFPALKVPLAYLEATEGPLWVAVRGVGLAYETFFIYGNVEFWGNNTGILSFHIDRSPDAFKGYSTSRAVIEAFISGERIFEEHGLEGVISTIIKDFASEHATMLSAATSGFVSQAVKGMPKNWSTRMLQDVRKVSVAMIKQAVQDFVLPVFLPGKAHMVATCSAIVQDRLKKDLEGAGFKSQIRDLASLQDDYGLEPEPGDEDEDEVEGNGNDDDDDNDDEVDDSCTL